MYLLYRKMGVRVVNNDVISFVDSVRALDFITFFGAPSSLSINQLVDVAKSKLSNGGGLDLVFDRIRS